MSGLPKTLASSPGGTPIQTGTLAARPPAGVPNRFYWATDVQMMFEDTGVIWVTAATPIFNRNLIADDISDSFYAGEVDGIGQYRICCMPLLIPYTMTLDRLMFIVRSAPVSNATMGLYEDNGNTPVGGALIVQSASQLCVADIRNFFTIANTRRNAGLCWIALALDTGGILLVYHPNFRALSPITERYTSFDGAFGAYQSPLPDPCPALPNAGAFTNIASMWARIASIP